MLAPAFPTATKMLKTSRMTYISVAVSVVSVLLIAFLLFCIFSERDLSCPCCPAQSDFGRRYSQMRTRVRSSVRGTVRTTVSSIRRQG